MPFGQQPEKVLQDVRNEEAQAGWILDEKLDDGKLRLSVRLPQWRTTINSRLTLIVLTMER